MDPPEGRAFGGPPQHHAPARNRTVFARIEPEEHPYGAAENYRHGTPGARFQRRTVRIMRARRRHSGQPIQYARTLDLTGTQRSCTLLLLASKSVAHNPERSNKSMRLAASDIAILHGATPCPVCGSRRYWFDGELWRCGRCEAPPSEGMICIDFKETVH
jgi:hypothetical protein